MLETMTEHSAPIPDVQKYTVLGSGIVGLLTANVLAEQGHDVTVISKEGRPDNQASNTSANAIGQFLPWVPEEHAETLLGDVDLAEVTDYSRQFYAELARNPELTGVMPIRNVELVQSVAPWPKGLPEAMAVIEEPLAEPVAFTDPKGEKVPFDTVLRFDTFSINARKAIGYLAEKAEKAGAKFVKAKFSKETMTELEGVVINATGIGAHEIDTVSQVNHFKGHTFVIKPRTGQQTPAEALSVEDLIIMPREDGTIICGALYIEDPARPVPEAEEAEALFSRLGALLTDVSDAGLVDGLSPDLIQGADIISHNVGYRVEADGVGIRVAPDDENERLLHAYGFGGIGWSVGPHFAHKIAAEAAKLHVKLKENQ